MITEERMPRDTITEEPKAPDGAGHQQPGEAPSSRLIRRQPDLMS